jgi:hypothetical protein
MQRTRLVEGLGWRRERGQRMHRSRGGWKCSTARMNLETLYSNPYTKLPIHTPPGLDQTNARPEDPES